ncbi:hypothetical protein [Maribellus mangrovi]|uniref:hypothetical protein n=1 Tax=Maribellus mangrovi TaxID=3133146 RepID=UPI0030EE0588
MYRLRFLTFTLLTTTLISVFSCSKEDDIIQTVSLSDEIPYGTIGTGKILFNRNYDYYLIDSEEQCVSELRIETIGNNCVISPNGEMIAYADYSDILHIVNIDGSVYAEQSYTKQCFSKISWSKDSKRIIYFDQCYGDPENLYELNVEEPCCTNRLIRTFGRSNVIYGISSPFSLSVNNDMVFYAITNEEFQQSGIYTMNKDGEDLKCIYTDDSVGVYFQNPYSHKSYSSPAWSPTDDRIAFASNTSGDLQNSSEIILIDPDGNNAETLVKFDEQSVNEGLNSISSICWSPDGTKIAFSISDEIFNQQSISHIYMIELITREITQLTFEEGMSDTGISWSE